jgi:hypothetical protein
MAITDTLSGSIFAKFDLALARAQSVGGFSGKDTIVVSKNQSFTDGTGTNQATGFFSSTFTAATGAGTTISLADSADPLGASGDDVPTSDPEGTKLRGILIINNDDTNFITVKRGLNGETSILTGGTDSIKISAGGFFAWTSPAGIDAMNDGVDDELTIIADTANCQVSIAYVYG